MRITAEARQKTRERLLAVAHRLLARRSLADVTTREVAEQAGSAHATLFNYFPTKEDLALALCRGLLDEAEADWTARRRGDESLEEDLFAHAAAGLRRLQPYRQWAGALLATALRPVPGAPEATGDDDPTALRARHLASVREAVARQRGAAAASPVALHLYWSLWLGVLAWWAADASENQAETLAVLDHSLRMFVASLDGAAPVPGDAR
jgi:AcrR family transcriptional regulator